MNTNMIQDEPSNIVDKTYEIDISNFIKRRLEEDGHFDETHDNRNCNICDWSKRPINVVQYDKFIIVTFENGNSIKVDIDEVHVKNGDEISYKLTPDGIDCDKFSEPRTRFTIPLYFADNGNGSITTRYNGYIDLNNNAHQVWFVIKLNENDEDERNVLRMSNYDIIGMPCFSVYHNSVFQVVQSTMNNHFPRDDDEEELLNAQVLVRLDMGDSVECILPGITRLEYPLRRIMRVCEIPNRDEIAICEETEGIHIVNIHTGIYTQYFHNNLRILDERSVIFHDVCCTSTTLIAVGSVSSPPFRHPPDSESNQKYCAYFWDINTREYKGKKELTNMGIAKWTLGYSAANDMAMIFCLNPDRVIVLYNEPPISRKEVKNAIVDMTPLGYDIAGIISGYTHGYLI
jgi:hypothetical protein